ncbi:MAG: ribosome small subunit-dependent GTPase A [Pseudomonadota bacterium]|nr:ribosome small subunit-dependent GTPase A [Pseudomonadota bacterium]
MSPFTLGWKEPDAQAWAVQYTHPPFSVDSDLPRAARVIALHRGATVVHDTFAEVHLPDPSVNPGADEGALAVGDWVAVQGTRVVWRLPRRGALTRNEAGRALRTQVLASNLDRVLILTSANQDLEPRRLDRMVAVAFEAGAQPVVVLTKADLDPEVGSYLDSLSQRLAGVPVVAVHTRDEHGVDALLPYLKPGETAMLLGTSGVGKSTLLNFLLGEARQLVREIRTHDDRGQHTTTHRELFALPGERGLLIDAPGIRELALGLATEGLERTFADIRALSEGCRFEDCGHSNEPACAVLAAVADGTLDPERLASFRTLLVEQAVVVRRIDPRTRHEGRRKARRRRNADGF